MSASNRLRGLYPALLILSFFSVIVLHGILTLSPAWDEIVYPAAGYTQLKTGAIHVNTEHPFLSKLLYGVPLLVLNPALPSMDVKDPYRYGYDFTFKNRVPPLTLILWSRVPALVFFILTGLAIFGGLRRLAGQSAGLAGLMAFCATPIFLSRAEFALLEMPMYFFMVASLALQEAWRRTGRRGWLWGCGIALGAALLCKMAAIPVVVTVLLMELVFIPGQKQVTARFLNTVIVSTACLLTFSLSYAIWGGGLAALRHVVETLIGFQKEPFYPFYFWNGRMLHNPPSPVSWFSFAVKAPPFLLLLAVIGLWQWDRSGKNRPILTTLLVLVVVTFMIVLSARDAVSSVQMSAVYLGVAGAVSGVSLLFSSEGKRFWKGTVIFLALCHFLDVGSVHPNYLAYFSPLVGGSDRGYLWRSDSDQDWGQSLPALARYLRRQGDPEVLLAYSGAADPQRYGIRYQDLCSPALVSKMHTGQNVREEGETVYVALGAKVIQSETRLIGWIWENRMPLEIVDQCFFVYDISRDVEAFRWMGFVYAAQNRFEKALWAFRRVQKMGRTVPDDLEMIGRLEKIIEDQNATGSRPAASSDGTAESKQEDQP
ncbi:MAG TPA: glycosyltransferase family 39 protein [Elusimicrobiota bacterium]|nr:glycosyltransferase family 39 protein [Elusimicrobiota bacterium]